MSPISLIVIPAGLWARDFATLAAAASAAARAHAVAPPGDRSDVQRYSEVAALIELRAAAMAEHGEATRVELDDVSWLADLPRRRNSWLTEVDREILIGAPDWIGRHMSAGGAVVQIGTGTSEADDPGPLSGPLRLPPTAEPVGITRDRDATASQLRIARAHDGYPLQPDGMPNDELSEAMRDLVRTTTKHHPSEVDVLYRDGSQARPLPLHAVSLLDDVPPTEITLSFALMSMRHPQLDRLVHGAWFRNAELSRSNVTHAEIDELAYQTSLGKLSDLRDLSDGPLRIDMYQAGLEPANVGFYRAVAETLLASPGVIAVQPRYYRGEAQPCEEGSLWASR